MSDGIVECLLETDFIVHRYCEMSQCRQFVQFIEHGHLIDDEISVQIQFDEILENVESGVCIAVRQLNGFDMIWNAIENLQCVQTAQFEHFTEVVQRIAFEVKELERFEDFRCVRYAQSANRIFGNRQLFNVWPKSSDVQQIRPLPNVASA